MYSLVFYHEAATSTIFKNKMDEEIIASFVHEINNSLYAIQLSVSHALTNLEPERKTQLLQGVLQQIDQIADLTKKLRDFSKSSQGVSEIEVKSFLKEMISLLTPYFKRKRITINTQFEGTPIFIKVNSNQLKEEFLNLIKRTETEVVGRSSGARELEIKVAEEGDRIIIEVMGPEVLTDRFAISKNLSSQI